VTGRLAVLVVAALGIVWLVEHLTGAVSLVVLVACGLGLVGRHLRRTGG
jgi:hypothetical protein